VSSRTLGLIALLAGIIVAVFHFSAAIPQDLAYHEFSDNRRLFGIDNFWNVVSNLPFLVVGMSGLWFIRRHAETVCVAGVETAYSVFFAGILLTAFGSAYYHLAPSNVSLVWDRLPMTIGFGALLTIIAAEFVFGRAARRLLLPLLIVGFASVEYWAWTEARGVGDLRPYAIVQFLPMLLIPVILLSRRPSLGETRYYWWVLFWYLLAKLFEYFDHNIFRLGHWLSGHSLKHLAAAMVPGVLLYSLTRRR
jgi:hypothetical protein